MNITLTYLYFDGEFFFSMVDFADKLKRIKDKISNNDKLREELADIYKSGALKRWSEALKDISKEEFPTVDMSSHLQATDSAVCSYLISLFTSDKEYKTGVATISEYISIDTVSMLNVRTGEKIASSKSGNCFIVDTFTFSDDDTDFQILISYSVLQIKNEILCCSLGSGGENIAIIDSDTSKKNVIGISLNQKVKRELMSETISKDSLKSFNKIYLPLRSENYTELIIISLPYRCIRFNINKIQITYDMLRVNTQQNEKHKFLYIGVWPIEINNQKEWCKNLTQNILNKGCYINRKVDFWMTSKISEVQDIFHQLHKQGFNVRLLTMKEYSTFVRQHRFDNVNNAEENEFVYSDEVRRSGGALSAQSLSKVLHPNDYGIYPILGIIREMLTLDKLDNIVLLTAEELDKEMLLTAEDIRNFQPIKCETTEMRISTLQNKLSINDNDLIFSIRLAMEDNI